eukprot:CAMPEP_0117443754 /NCGR_PEP_ID=MMETSP0759-20121206/4868_1 /TAXON_ID=63605 /ORGANISM="Percolomonas cosmopolitus, Strain WS" /LENGTH=414 /DNA_ID=CAMNT_0005235759 /DNA_START=29 /DNA_END=1273 /DNA_ORIENTATION=-
MPIITSLFETKLIDNTNTEFNLTDLLKGKSGFLVYFSAHWCGPCRSFTPKLKDLYENHLQNRSEVIFCSLDKNQEAFDEYFKEMPWKAIPFSSKLREELRESMGVSGIPTLISFDTNGNVLSKDAKSMALSDPEAKSYPWKDKSVYELVGDVVDKEGNVTKSNDLKKAAVLGLYFSAHWCGPCRQATPVLSKLYTKLKDEGKDFEIVFCSSDRDEGAFKEYFSSMPWKSLPYERRDDKEALSRRFSVRGIPTLILLEGGSLKVISDIAIQEMYDDPQGEKFPWRPAPLMALSNQAMSKVNGGRLLVMLAEKVSDADTVKIMEKALNNVATKKVDQWKGLDQRPLHFTFGGPGAQLAPQVRQFLQMGEATSKADVAIVDGKTGLLFSMKEEPTEESISQFVDNVLEGKLSGKSLQ